MTIANAITIGILAAAAMCAVSVACARGLAAVLLAHADTIETARRAWRHSWQRWSTALVPELLRENKPENKRQRRVGAVVRPRAEEA